MKYDQLPQLTRLIDWESLGLRAERADTAVGHQRPPPVPLAGERGLPDLGTDGLPLPLSATRHTAGELSDPAHMRQDLGTPPYQAGPPLDDGQVPHAGVIQKASSLYAPNPDDDMRRRLQQCLGTLHSAGFTSVDSFAVAYYSTRLSHSPHASSIGLQGNLSLLGRLVMVLQSASSRADPVEAAGLHNGIAEAARDLYKFELRALGLAPYTPQLAEYQVSRQMRVFICDI
jgi:hypothetical protein